VSAQRKPPAQVTVSLDSGRPLLDEGTYEARCVEADCQWSRRYRKWVAIFKMKPLDYKGKAYTGDVCKFFNLGNDPKGPHAGAGSQFRRLWVQANGAQPTSAATNLDIFVGRLFQIQVSTVTKDRNENPLCPAEQYSVIRNCSAVLTLQPYNPLTQQPDNPATPQPLTLKETQQPSNPLTPFGNKKEGGKVLIEGFESEKGKKVLGSSSLGRPQQTVHLPEHGVESDDSAPCGKELSWEDIAGPAKSMPLPAGPERREMLKQQAARVIGARTQ
jgi:hypothetical protein